MDRGKIRGTERQRSAQSPFKRGECADACIGGEFTIVGSV